jgi:transcriptional regulator with XRE-family HTH domain
MSSKVAYLGAGIRTWRLRRRLSQEALGGATGFSRQHVGEVERGQGTVSETFVALCDQVLRAGGELKAMLPGVVCEEAAARHRRQAARRAVRARLPRLRTAGACGTPLTAQEARWRPYQDLVALDLLEVVSRVRPATGIGDGREGRRRAETWENRLWMALPRGLGEIDRREFFGYLSAATAAFLTGTWTLTGEGIEHLGAAMGSPGRLDEAAVDQLEQMAVLFRRSMQEVRLPTRIQVGEAVSQMKRLLALDPPAQPERVRRRLVRLVGEHAALAGFLSALAMNDFAAGEGYLSIAHAAAREAGHRELEALVFAYRSYQAAYDGQPAEALELAEAGDTLGRGISSSTTRAYLAVATAEMQARRGADAACLRAVDRAKTALANVNDPRSGTWIGFGSFDDVSLAANEGSILLLLDHPGEAMDVLRSAVARADPAHSHHGYAVANLATAFVSVGEVDEGCRHAEEALATGLRFEDSDAIRMVRELYEGPLQRARDLPSVRHVRDRLREEHLSEL